MVTVVFVDLVGSTKLANQLDPERFREVLAAFHGMVTEEVEWLRGRAESFIGDAVLAVFGVPTSHDDDAVRAIRAALSVVDRAPELGRELGLPTPMQVHVGINTGTGGGGDRRRPRDRDRRRGEHRRAAAAGRRCPMRCWWVRPPINS